MQNFRLLLSVLVAVLCVCLCRVASASYPHDPPVTSGGNGSTGNDWVDFPDQVLIDAVGLFKVGEDFMQVSIPYFYETADNPLFNYDENQLYDGTGLDHLCPRVDFESVRFPGDNLVGEANDYWSWYYEGYYPAIYASSTPPAGFYANRATTRNNCVSFTFNGYAGASTGWWLQDAGALSLLRGQSYAIWDSNHGDTASVSYGEVCVTCDNNAEAISTPHGEGSSQTWYPWNGYHTWWINDDGAEGARAAHHIIWKNCTSQIFEWDHDESHNCSPAASDGSTLYSHDFEIWGSYYGD
jgi:hypothetical protein